MAESNSFAARLRCAPGFSGFHACRRLTLHQGGSGRLEGAEAVPTPPHEGGLDTLGDEAAQALIRG